EVFEDLKVPDVLLSGHHARIEAWRQEERIKKTKERRPDLYNKWLSEQKKD
ncbi:TPA: tRNA (guanosine(37)-N1)-methyltransferase TrmD, partial [Candidatus Marinimicrobia bacterium]|nr:tRNA (guanosine(37)-N1)-methyltransferase TrmD [Candidatus Neomarinimicrobiota bacterium]